MFNTFLVLRVRRDKSCFLRVFEVSVQENYSLLSKVGLRGVVILVKSWSLSVFSPDVWIVKVLFLETPIHVDNYIY